MSHPLDEPTTAERKWRIRLSSPLTLRERISLGYRWNLRRQVWWRTFWERGLAEAAEACTGSALSLAQGCFGLLLAVWLVVYALLTPLRLLISPMWLALRDKADFLHLREVLDGVPKVEWQGYADEDPLNR